MRSDLRAALVGAVAALGGLGGGVAARADDVDLAVERRAAPVQAFADWVVGSGDNAGLPFVIVDKRAAEVVVFDPEGRTVGSAPALLGSAAGDESAPGVGERELNDVLPEERTTPAGRFVAAYGPAWGGRQVLWVDFDTALSLHPVATGNPKEQRLRRLATATPEDNRITYGCINVSADFYRAVIRKQFKASKGVVYILPESKPLNEVFPNLALQSEAAEPIW